MNIGTFLMFFPLACVAGEMENPGRDRIRPDAPPYWDEDSRSLVSRSMGRNEANNPCYTETRKTLSPDGMLLPPSGCGR